MNGLLTWAGIAICGGAGSLARFHLDRLVPRPASGLPVGTLAVNAGGSLLLGLLVGANVTGTTLLLAGSATLGAFTTFSTWMFETHRLLEDGERTVALANVAVSLVAGLAAAAAGWALGAVL